MRYMGLIRYYIQEFSYLYNWVGPTIAPNMVTNIVFDWRGYDTLGEADFGKCSDCDFTNIWKRKG